MNEKAQPRSRQEIEAQIIAKVWRDEAYKQELLNNPKAVIERELGRPLNNPNANLQILEENVNQFYFVLPMKPNLSEVELNEEQLESVAGGWPGQGVITEIREAGKGLGEAISQNWF
jgi:hypothetical protein